jgi:hypothetical protein
MKQTKEKSYPSQKILNNNSIKLIRIKRVKSLLLWPIFKQKLILL